MGWRRYKCVVIIIHHPLLLLENGVSIDPPSDPVNLQV